MSNDVRDEDVPDYLSAVHPKLGEIPGGPEAAFNTNPGLAMAAINIDNYFRLMFREAHAENRVSLTIAEFAGSAHIFFAAEPLSPAGEDDARLTLYTFFTQLSKIEGHKVTVDVEHHSLTAPGRGAAFTEFVRRLNQAPLWGADLEAATKRLAIAYTAATMHQTFARHAVPEHINPATGRIYAPKP